MNMMRRLRPSAVAMAMALITLAACTQGSQNLGNPDRLDAVASRQAVDQGLAAMARGEYGQAETYFNAALQYNRFNAYALFAAASLYQETGRREKAVDLYRRLLSLETQEVISIGPWGDLHSQSLHQAALDSLRALGAATPVSPAKSSAPEPAAASDHRAERFRIMKALFDRGLVTPTEYGSRRQSNLGALLPYSVLPAATGLESPPPEEKQVADRLEALRRNYELGSITAQQLKEERKVILDALLPASPQARTAAESRISSPQAENAARDRTKRLLSQGLISDAEAKKELAAIERLTPPRPKPAAPPKATAAKAKPPTPPPGEPAKLLPSTNPAATLRSGRETVTVVPNPPNANNPDAPVPPSSDSASSGLMVAIHLASFRSHDKAVEGWKALQEKYSVLRQFSPFITSIDLPDKGRFYRLNAGPLGSREHALDFCQKNLPGLYCVPVFLGG